jgi:2,4-dienoyl-CoA reductase-like NADH-dependent reductase (Old Yellow Enzyme family)
VILRNRIVFLQHGNGLADHEFLPTERQAYYFAERAKGGAAVIILGASLVLKNAMSYFGRNLISDKRAIPGLKKIAEMVHEHGAKMFGQLSHQGRQTTSQISRLPAWAPSPIPCTVNREVPKEMEREDMEEVIDGFIRGARNEREAGFDGVEVYAAHGYLLSQFLSPHSNKRKDEYGGSFENRLRFPLEVIGAVRKEVGKDYVVGFRMNGDDLTPGGLSPEELKQVAIKVAGTGMIDYLSISAGTYNSRYLWISDMVFPPGPLVPLASGIKEVVDLPVICANRVNDPLQAEKILAEGHADLIGMCRALICDP